MALSEIIVGIKRDIYNNIHNNNVIHNYKTYLPISEVNNREKNALVSYLTTPFSKSKKKIRFSNDGIAISIPRALNELGYNVDIINWNNLNFIPTKKYDLFLGHTGSNFKNIYNNLNKDAVIICFSPGDYWQFANNQEKKRFDNLKQRRGVNLPFDRYHFNYASEDFSYSVADGIICLGDKSVLEPYSKFPSVLTLNNASYHDDHYEKTGKNFENTKNNFVFFAGGGNVHKGLDLLLDAFAKSDKSLYICTALEPEFKKIYKNELKRHNIHYMGWVKQRSKKFYQIIDKCAFIIFPSCSEGSAGSVVECMNQGLIPIVSRETRIDVTDFGIFLKDCTVEEIYRVIEEVSEKPLTWIKDKSLFTRQAAVNDYSEEVFIKNIKSNILKITDGASRRKNNLVL